MSIYSATLEKRITNEDILNAYRDSPKCHDNVDVLEMLLILQELIGNDSNEEEE